MLHALTPAGDLDVSVRARRPACVLDPALLLAAPHALLLAQQLSRTVDLWVCPAFWRLLDASEFFGRRPARLRTWLALANDHSTDAVGAAIEAWSRWRVSRDLAALGLYWVGGHQTESFLPENGPRDLPARFEGLMDAWLRAGDGEDALVANDIPAARHGTVRPLPGLRVETLAPVEEDAEAQAPSMPCQQQEGRLEAAALSVVLQAPVLTLAATGSDAPGLVRQWADSGLAGTAWHAVHPASALAEHERWWSATIASGAAATVAAASAIGVRLGLAQVVAPSGQFLPEAEPAWVDELAGGDAWDADPVAPREVAGTAATAWWRDAQALWMPL